jgi:hypothetical protein
MEAIYVGRGLRVEVESEKYNSCAPFSDDTVFNVQIVLDPHKGREDKHRIGAA